MSLPQLRLEVPRPKLCLAHLLPCQLEMPPTPTHSWDMLRIRMLHDRKLLEDLSDILPPDRQYFRPRVRFGFDAYACTSRSRCPTLRVTHPESIIDKPGLATRSLRLSDLLGPQQCLAISLWTPSVAIAHFSSLPELGFSDPWTAFWRIRHQCTEKLAQVRVLL